MRLHCRVPVAVLGGDHGLDVADVGQIALMILISLLVPPAAMAGRIGRRAALFCTDHRSEPLPLAANDNERI